MDCWFVARSGTGWSGLNESVSGCSMGRDVMEDVQAEENATVNNTRMCDGYVRNNDQE